MLEAPRLVLLLVAVVGLVQVGFLMLLLRHEGKRAFRANRWLMLFALSAGLSFMEDIINVLAPAYVGLVLAPVFLAVVFCFVPAIYLYFCEIANAPVRRPISHFAIIVPATIAMTVVIVLILRDFKPLLVDGRDIEIDIATHEHLLLVSILLAVFGALYVQLFVYMPKIWKLALDYLRRAEQQLGADQKVLRRWARELLLGVSMIFVVFTAASLIDVFITDSDWLDTLVQGSFAVVFFKLSHTIASNPTLFLQADWDGVSRHGMATLSVTQDASVAKSGKLVASTEDTIAASGFVSAEDVAKYKTRLDQVIADRDILFDPLLSMPKLAGAIGAKPNQLSFVLNQHLGKSFFDFINEARTREASRLLIAQPDRTILDIATEVGFNSKSTFNLAFKKITGRTPSVYRRENGV